MKIDAECMWRCALQVARLRSHLDQIKRDDRLIKNEGIEALLEDELRQACRARGMRAPFGEGAVTFMRKQLKEWLDLSLNRQGPALLRSPCPCQVSCVSALTTDCRAC